MLICFNDYLEIVVSYMLLAIFATMEKMFIEVARKTICEILTAAASALVGHLYDENHFFQHPKLSFILSQTKIILILSIQFINIFEWMGKIIYSTYVVISLIQRQVHHCIAIFISIFKCRSFDFMIPFIKHVTLFLKIR